MNTDLHPGMMGDGTEEQNLGQIGDPAARITEAEVQSAFGGPHDVAEAVEERVDSAAQVVEDGIEDASAAAAAATEQTWLSLKDRAAAVREQVEKSAESVRAWASEQGEAVKQTAADKPVLVVSASAGAALAVGLAIGFLLGRATADA
jgi:hypothetical protein